MSLEKVGLGSPEAIFPFAEAPASLKKTKLETEISETIRAGQEFLFSVQRWNAHWCAELESNPSITAEYVFLVQILNLDVSGKKEALTRYFLNLQNADGGWGIAREWPSDVSTAAEVYLALRILGLDRGVEAMRNAEAFIRGAGGLEKARVFTRINFAMFGLIPWESVPTIPPEFILFPASSPINIYSLSSWARGTMVPLFIIFHHKPIFALPNGRDAHNPWLDHLWLRPENKKIPYSLSFYSILKQNGPGWASFFAFCDEVLKRYEKIRFSPLRKFAVRRCTQWVLDRQEPSGDWAGIFPPMLNGIIALTLQGFAIDSDPIRKGLEAIASFSWEDSTGYRIQACVSPVWDTVLSTIGLIDSGTAPSDHRLAAAMQWVKERQLLVEHGDWKVYRPDLPSGGWSFEHFNSWYPDTDDTAAVILALLKQRAKSANEETVTRALQWLIGMQNKDGGWGAFDVENDKLFLNKIPFSDMDSLCDPSTPDVTGRVLEAFGLWLRMAHPHSSPGLQEKIRSSIEQGITYLRRSQEAEGSWFGRWGVNYIYGTSNVLCGLAQVGLTPSDPMLSDGIYWLLQVQNSDGGWGEDLKSYSDRAYMGKGLSSASQTAWGLMGLLSFLSADEPAIHKGVRWLITHQVPPNVDPALDGGHPTPTPRGGTWDETAFTGTGFPNHFYLRYHYYRHYFPMMALGRFVRSRSQA